MYRFFILSSTCSSTKLCMHFGLMQLSLTSSDFVLPGMSSRTYMKGYKVDCLLFRPIGNIFIFKKPPQGRRFTLNLNVLLPLIL